MAKFLDLSGIASALGRMVYSSPYVPIAGVSPDNWPTASQPVRPIGPPGSKPLNVPIWYGMNLTFTPRPDAQYTASDLMALSMYPLSRLCIGNVKDTIGKLSFNIQLRQKPGESNGDVKQRRKKDTKGDPLISTISRMMERPNSEQDFSDWVRNQLESMLTIDAASTLILRNLKGKVTGFRGIPGDNISRYVDDEGNTPAPPSPAYLQLWQGAPRCQLSTDQLLYRPRNFVYIPGVISSYLYGCSATQSLAEEIKIGIGRLNYILAYYQKGAVGNVIHVVPPGISTDKIREVMQFINSMMSGNNAARREWLSIPGFSRDGKEQIIFPKEPVLADVFDDVHTRKIAFGYGNSPQRLQRALNRGCHSEDTQTLTENGWKYYWEISGKEKIATVNPKTYEMEYQIPSRKVVYPFSGELFRFKSRNVDILVTPDHRMWASKYSHDRKVGGFYCPYSPIMAKYVYGAKVSYKFSANTVYDGVDVKDFSLPSVVHGTTGDDMTVPSIPMDDWLEFLGYYISEGGMSNTTVNPYVFTLAQNEEVNWNVAEKIQKCLDRLPFHSKKYPKQSDGMARWNVNGKVLCSYLSHNAGNVCSNKRIPREFLKLSYRQMSILFHALMDGDGSWDPREGRNCGSYSTTSQQLANDVQELALKLGYCASIRMEPRDFPRNDRYVVLVCRRDEHTIRPEKNISKEKYKGAVYCFTVPNGIFITRRNGKISMHCNSAQASQEASEQEGMQPFLDWIERTANTLIQVYMGYDDYELEFQPYQELDYVKKAAADVAYVKEGIRTRKDISDELGDDPPVPVPPMWDKPTITLPNGLIALEDVDKMLPMMTNSGNPKPPKDAPRSPDNKGYLVERGKVNGHA